MPELPEVEITRRHLAEAMVGRKVQAASLHHARTSRFNASPDEVEVLLVGRSIQSVGRLGKFLVIELDDGHTVVGHLGMSGRFSVTSPDANVEPHTHFIATLDDGKQIRFIDPRTFGFVAVFDAEALAESGVARLGRDALLDLPETAELLSFLQGRSAPIKALLLDQRLVSGLGNIYADEALFMAALNPLLAGGDLTSDQVDRLRDSIARVLEEAIENGGTTLDDLAYLLPDGKAGDNMSVLAVYGRTGEPCRQCGSGIDRVVVRGRSTHFCPECQPQ